MKPKTTGPITLYLHSMARTADKVEYRLWPWKAITEEQVFIKKVEVDLELPEYFDPVKEELVRIDLAEKKLKQEAFEKLQELEALRNNLLALPHYVSEEEVI